MTKDESEQLIVFLVICFFIFCFCLWERSRNDKHNTSITKNYSLTEEEEAYVKAEEEFNIQQQQDYLDSKDSYYGY